MPKFEYSSSNFVGKFELGFSLFRLFNELIAFLKSFSSLLTLAS